MAGHKMLSFVDVYFRYNQIMMAEEDQEKATFTTDRDLYCYRMMPFGLKKAGATYQRLINKMFASLIGKMIEIYVDNMLVKSLSRGQHIEHLREYFNSLRLFWLKLNPDN